MEFFISIIFIILAIFVFFFITALGLNLIAELVRKILQTKKE